MNQHELESCFTSLCFGSVTPTPQKRGSSCMGSKHQPRKICGWALNSMIRNREVRLGWFKCSLEFSSSSVLKEALLKTAWLTHWTNHQRLTLGEGSNSTLCHYNNNYLWIEIWYGSLWKTFRTSEATINKFNHKIRLNFEHRPRAYIFY